MEEAEKAAKYLQDAGYDMLNCDNGTYDAWYWAHPPIYMPENCNLADVEHIKGFVSVPVVAAGRMDPVVGAEAVKENKLDAVGFARPFLADPAYATKLMEGKEETIRPCICCHNGCFNMCHYKGVANDQDLSDALHMARCAVNAETMQTNKHYIKKTAHPKKVAIIGGGIGGMEAARVLKLRGHEPVIYEKSNELGGVFIAAGKASFKGKLRELLEWYKLQMKELQIDVKLNTEIKDVSSLKADKIIVATGSKPIVPKIIGVENAIEACDFLLGKEVGETVAVIGGGLTGCEIAYELALDNKKPIIVEMKDDLVKQKGICMANSQYLRDYFALHKIPVHLETTLIGINENAIVCKDKEGKATEIPCDSVILALGYRSNPMKIDKAIIIGDAAGVGNLRTVIWQAYEAAMKI